MTNPKHDNKDPVSVSVYKCEGDRKSSIGCLMGKMSDSDYKVDLSVDIADIRLPNPTILASGILGVSSEVMVRASRAGAGGVVTKSFNRKGREGYRNPSFIEVPGGYLNALGIPNPGMDEMREEVAVVSKAGVSVIASVFGFDGEEFAAAASKGEEGGAIAIDLNVSCQHVREVGVEI